MFASSHGATRFRRAVGLAGVVAILAGTAVLGASPAAAADPHPILRYGALTLGVNPLGDLNYSCFPDRDLTCPQDYFYGADSGEGTRNIFGLSRNVEGFRLDALAPGGLNEGWGVGDEQSQVRGYANEAEGGTDNVEGVSFSVTPTKITSVVDIARGESERNVSFRVTHTYERSADSNLFQGTVTIENTGADTADDVRYRRNLDWDVAPSATNEYITVQGTPQELRFDSDRSFASSNPLSGPDYDFSQSVCGEEYTGPCEFHDLGDDGNDSAAGADHGALFDFSLGQLATDQQVSFKLFYGAATSEAAAISSLTAVGAQTYSLAQTACRNASVDGCSPDQPGGGGEGGGFGRAARGPVVQSAEDDGPRVGTPVTFMLGFKFERRADVSLTKTAPAGPIPTGTNYTYTLAARNNTRGTTATGVTITDPLPAGTSLVSASSGCTGTSTITCSLGSLAPFATKTRTVTVRANTPGTKTNTATVTTTTTDPNADNDRDTVTTVVVQGNRTPNARNDSYSTDQDTLLQVSAPGVQANDSDPDGGTLTTTLLSGPTHGVATIGANGALNYAPDVRYSGPDSLRYRLRDADGASDTARVRITVQPTSPTTVTPSTPTTPPTTPTAPTTEPAPTSGTPDIPTDEPTEPDTTEPTTPEPTPTPSPSESKPPVVGLQLSTPSVNPGGRLDATGSGCGKNETVQLSIDGTAAGTGTSGGDGSFSVPITAPDLPLGNHTVTSLCGGLRQVATVSFVYVTADSSAPGAQALTVGTMLAFFLLLLTITLRRPGR